MLDNSTILIYNVIIEIKINSGGKKMKILRVVEYTDLDDENHKSQEEYQMIHNALSESEDLPF